jgi:ABC-type nitrate/sulfonate/bicarbonate transport system substrate-binding protein
MITFAHGAATRRDVLAFGAALAATGTLGSKALAQGATAPLQVGLIRNPVAGLIEVADKKGWFKESGANIQTTLFAGAAGPKILQAMAGGSIGLTTVSATAAILALASDAIPMKIVSISTDPAPLFMLLSRPEIDAVPKLAGKRVSAPSGTGLQYFLGRALAKHGMTLKDVEYVNLPAAEAQAAFLAGRVDALVPSLIGALFIQKAKPDTRRLFSHGDFTKGPGATAPFVDYDVFVVPDSVLSGQRDAVKGFLAGYHDKAVPYVLDNATQNQAIKEITDYVNTEQKTPTDADIMRELLVQSGFFRREEARRLMQADGFVAGLEDQVKFFTDSGQLKASVPMKPAVVADLL